MRYKILIISFILSLPFWWGINVLAGNLENFWYWQEMADSYQILNAEMNQRILERKINELKLDRERIGRLENLELDAKAVISVEVDSRGNEKILLERDSQRPLPIASLTKLMTALVIFDLDETYDLNQLIAVSEEAVSQEGRSKYRDLIAGEEISVENLIYVMLLESSNDAAFGLTQPIGKEGFVGLMNLYSKRAGLLNTYFVNPTGLDPDDSGGVKNYSTAEDLVRLTKYILENHPRIFEITTNQSYKVLRPNGSLHYFITENTNRLLDESNSWGTKIIGGKTGWSISASGCLLLVLDNPRKEGYFINIVLGATDRFEEMGKIIEALNEN